MGFLKDLFSSKNTVTNNTTTKESKQILKHSPSSRIDFLQQTINPDEIVKKDPKISEINTLINHSVDFYNNDNFARSVVCLNTAIKLEPSFNEEIALRRNRAVALAGFLGLGKTKPQQNFDYCYSMEYLTRDLEAIIGLFATNEEKIAGRDDADFLEDCFNMALSNYMSIGMAYMAYEENGSHHVYKDQLPRVWDIGFVPEPKNALQVNGTIYPHHKLPK